MILLAQNMNEATPMFSKIKRLLRREEAVLVLDSLHVPAADVEILDISIQCDNATKLVYKSMTGNIW